MSEIGHKRSRMWEEDFLCGREAAARFSNNFIYWRAWWQNADAYADAESIEASFQEYKLRNVEQMQALVWVTSWCRRKFVLDQRTMAVVRWIKKKLKDLCASTKSEELAQFELRAVLRFVWVGFFHDFLFLTREQWGQRLVWSLPEHDVDHLFTKCRRPPHQYLIPEKRLKKWGRFFWQVYPNMVAQHFSPAHIAVWEHQRTKRRAACLRHLDGLLCRDVIQFVIEPYIG